MTTRQRADRLLVARGLFESRARAQAAIAAGRVTADGVLVRKPSEEISTAAVIEAEPAHPYVSRGGVKLAAALDHFALDVAAASVSMSAPRPAALPKFSWSAARGASMPSMSAATSCIPSLRGRDEIVSMEETDIRKLDPSHFAEQPDFATVDVSFISLKLVLPAVGKLLRRARKLVALIKPQFEAQRRNIKKGIVRDDVCSHRGLRRHCRLSRRARLARRRPRAVADSRRRRQSRILYRGRAWLSGL